jgi:hypothetical protein
MRALLILVVILLLLIGAAAGFAWYVGWLDPWLATPIGEIRANPGDYPDGSRVTIHGAVVGRTDVPFTDKDIYEVKDESGQMLVRTETGLPPEGARVTVTGTLVRVDEDLKIIRLKGIVLKQARIRIR